MSKLIITPEVLGNFAPCVEESPLFAERYPDGIDISGLWGSKEERQRIWKRLLSDDFITRQIGWAIRAGVLPARIEADLWGANLIGANLRGANLIGANLSEAKLIEADLSEANLREANLWGANLSEADLWEANLIGAKLIEADLWEANLRGANLREATLRGANLSEAKCNRYTQWPDNFDTDRLK